MKFTIENFGCQMNDHDMERMRAILVERGLTSVDAAEDADVVIVNTCCVRQKAEQKFYSRMGRLRTMKRKRGTILGVTGCIAQLEKEDILGRLPFVDFSLGPSSVHRIAEALEGALQKRPVFDFTLDGNQSFACAKPAAQKGSVKASVTIMKGCDNFCSYCVVPYVRGRETSRESSSILDEVRELASMGVKEVTLLGQNVNSYNKNRVDISFPELIAAIDGIAGIERIRFVTSHPKDLSPELIACFGTLSTLCESIHLPFQSGSDKILKLMNRGYSANEYLAKIAALKKQCPGIAITSDCIVGFPGEDDKDFQATMDLIDEVRFDGIFSFAYSPRKFTKAAHFPGVVAEETALDRLRRFQLAQKSITIEKNRAMEGKCFEVLVEDVSKNSKEEMKGRTRSNKVVNFQGSGGLINKLVEVDIIKGYANSLRGDNPRLKGGRRC